MPRSKRSMNTGFLMRKLTVSVRDKTNPVELTLKKSISSVRKRSIFSWNTKNGLELQADYYNRIRMTKSLHRWRVRLGIIWFVLPSHVIRRWAYHAWELQMIQIRLQLQIEKGIVLPLVSRVPSTHTYWGVISTKSFLCLRKNSAISTAYKDFSLTVGI